MYARAHLPVKVAASIGRHLTTARLVERVQGPTYRDEGLTPPKHKSPVMLVEDDFPNSNRGKQVRLSQAKCGRLIIRRGCGPRMWSDAEAYLQLRCGTCVRELFFLRTSLSLRRRPGRS